MRCVKHAKETHISCVCARRWYERVNICAALSQKMYNLHDEAFM